MFNFLLIYFLIIEYLHAQYEIIDIQFQSGTSRLPGNRDGLLMATLNDGRQTTICNYKFDNIIANIACKTLGYPPIGYSYINEKNSYNITSPVLLGYFQCDGSESDLRKCRHLSQLFKNDCGSHLMDVYVYCLQPKTATNISSITKCTPTSSVRLYSTDSYTNQGYLLVTYSGKNASVCDDEFSLTETVAEFYCKKMCGDTVVNPMLMISSLAPPPVNLSVKVVCHNNDCNIAENVFSCGNIVSIKCGEEPSYQETSPEILCSKDSVTVRWSLFAKPFINNSLVKNIGQECANAIYIDNKNYSVYIVLNLNTSIISSTNTSILYTCFLKRFYLTPSNSLPYKTIQVTCTTPKPSSSSDNVTIADRMRSSISGKISTNVKMTFYADSSFKNSLPPTYTVNADQVLYVVLEWKTPSVNTLLIIQDCTVFNDSITSTTSVKIINNRCPVSDYNVVIFQLSRNKVGFQFTPFNFYERTGPKVYVSCTLTKCSIKEKCRFCWQNLRKKRSPVEDIVGNSVAGPIFIQK